MNRESRGDEPLQDRAVELRVRIDEIEFGTSSNMFDFLIGAGSTLVTLSGLVFALPTGGASLILSGAGVLFWAGGIASSKLRAAGKTTRRKRFEAELAVINRELAIRGEILGPAGVIYTEESDFLTVLERDVDAARDRESVSPGNSQQDEEPLLSNQR